MTTCLVGKMSGFVYTALPVKQAATTGQATNELEPAQDGSYYRMINESI